MDTSLEKLPELRKTVYNYSSLSLRKMHEQNNIFFPLLLTVVHQIDPKTCFYEWRTLLHPVSVPVHRFKKLHCYKSSWRLENAPQFYKWSLVPKC